MERVGLLAGVGRLPVECAKAAQAMGMEVYAVALLPDVDREIASFAKVYEEISIAHLDAILEFLQKNEIKKVTMIGKVTKELLFKAKVQPDPHLLKLLLELPNMSDDTIMLMFVRELQKAGVEALDQTALISPLMPQRGAVTKREPTEAEARDLELGLRMAKEIGRLDVGQTAVVKQGAVMALEAIEGTDACIKRGGELSGGGAVVAKAAKPAQDNRFDVPTVGLKTIEGMAAVGATALGIEAGKTLLVDKEKVLALAEAHNIAIIAL